MLVFAYQIGATDLTSGTWTPVATLDFTGPIATDTAVVRSTAMPALTGWSLLRSRSIWLWHRARKSGCVGSMPMIEAVITVWPLRSHHDCANRHCCHPAYPLHGVAQPRRPRRWRESRCLVGWLPSSGRRKA